MADPKSEHMLELQHRLDAEREHRMRETARADRERTLRLLAESHINAAGDGMNLAELLDHYHERMTQAEGERDEMVADLAEARGRAELYEVTLEENERLRSERDGESARVRHLTERAEKAERAVALGRDYIENGEPDTVWNAGMRNLLGVREGESIGEAAARVVAERDEARAKVAALVEGKPVFIRKDGTLQIGGAELSDETRAKLAEEIDAATERMVPRRAS